MAVTTYITLIKKFTYRGNATEEWSNSYALSGSTPTDATAWRTLFDALVAEEKKLYPAENTVVGGYGYNKIPVKGDHAIWSVDLTQAPNSPVAGTFVASGTVMSGDQACWIRWGLDRYNTRGKRVYLRKYFHGGTLQGSPNQDKIANALVTALDGFGLKMRDGTFAGGRKITDRLETTILGHGVSTYVTTRTLKRRGKRPPT